MTLAQQISKQFREVYLDGKWVAFTNLKKELTGVNWEQATTKVSTLNTIAALTYHLNYYVSGLLRVLQGGPLDIRDKYSFDCPPIESQADWEKLLLKSWQDAEQFAALVATLSDDQLFDDFIDPQYGNYHKNIHAIIEHGYYHLGQIVLIRKLLAADSKEL